MSRTTVNGDPISGPTAGNDIFMGTSGTDCASGGADDDDINLGDGYDLAIRQPGDGIDAPHLGTGVGMLDLHGAGWHSAEVGDDPASVPLTNGVDTVAVLDDAPDEGLVTCLAGGTPTVIARDNVLVEQRRAGDLVFAPHDDDARLKPVR
jgi:hypothetical protein